MNKPVIIIGNGGHASVLIEMLHSQGREIIGYTDVKKSEKNSRIPYLGNDTIIQENYNAKEIELVLGLGSIKVTEVREKLFKYFTELGFTFAQVIHQMAIISPSVILGQGVQIMAGVVLQTNTIIGDNAIINTGTTIDHDCQIGSHVHIAPGCTLSGGVEINNNSHIGTGVSIIQNITIGEKSTIGAGSVVVRNIGAEKIAYGVPAKEV